MLKIDIPPTFGERLAKARKAAGYTQQTIRDALAKRGADKTKSAIGHWETGHAAPDMETLVLLCELYEVSADYLLFGKARVESVALRLDAETRASIAGFKPPQLDRLANTIKNRVQELSETVIVDSNDESDLGNAAGRQTAPPKSARL